MVGSGGLAGDDGRQTRYNEGPGVTRTISMQPKVSLAQDETERAMDARARSMREMGLSEDEIRTLCDPRKYPVQLEEELQNLKSVDKIRQLNQELFG